MLTLKCDSERCQKPRGVGRLPNKGRYKGMCGECKTWAGKNFPKKPNARAKKCPKT